MKGKPKDVELIGNEVAVRWADDTEIYLPAGFLREHSPSAENIGEVDILGQRHGGDGPRNFDTVSVVGWDWVGGYAIRFEFSDGHRTGIYSFDLLEKLAAMLSD